METWKNAAALLFSLSVVDENKITIGASGAIPAHVSLLNEGSQRGKQAGANTLFNLCIYQENKGQAVRGGVVPTLMMLLTEPAGLMVDETLAILVIISSHVECKLVIGALQVVPVLVEVIWGGSPRNKKNAAAVLLHLCTGKLQQQHLVGTQECSIMEALIQFASNGTDRGKKKASQLLNRMNRLLEKQSQAQVQT